MGLNTFARNLHASEPHATWDSTSGASIEGVGPLPLNNGRLSYIKSVPPNLKPKPMMMEVCWLVSRFGMRWQFP